MTRWSPSTSTESSTQSSLGVDETDTDEQTQVNRPGRDEIIIELSIIAGCAFPALLYVVVAASAIRDGGIGLELWVPPGLAVGVGIFASLAIVRGSISSRESTLLSLAVIWFGASVGIGILALFEVGVIPALESLVGSHDAFSSELLSSLRTGLYATGGSILGVAAVLSYAVRSAGKREKARTTTSNSEGE